jgi:hypothetical protein
MADDTCGRCPQAEFVCPQSGTFSVLVGEFAAGFPFICDIAGGAAP